MIRRFEHDIVVTRTTPRTATEVRQEEDHVLRTITEHLVRMMLDQKVVKIIRELADYNTLYHAEVAIYDSAWPFQRELDKEYNRGLEDALTALPLATNFDREEVRKRRR